MNHRSKRRHFGRPTSHREAMFRNLAISLLLHGQIKTTLPKAKDLRGIVEPLITRAKTNTLANRRYLISKLRNKDAIQKLLLEYGPLYQSRPGGYLRILKCGFRAGDAAPMAIVQLVGLSESGS
ncbi:MAG: 50S ribosomal protein L17 [Pseudomonadota bacterium]|nr:50S ribosomal protein L17 [Pseudomonadota bacterium]